MEDFQKQEVEEAPLFRNQIEALRRGSWVVVDEVQRMPSLLNEVHALSASTGAISALP